MLSALLQASYNQVEAEAATQFMAGYMQRFTDSDEQEYFKTCFVNDQSVSDIMDKAMQFQEQGDYEDAMKEWKKMAVPLSEDIKACSKIYGEYERVKEFEKGVFERPDAQQYIRQMI